MKILLLFGFFESFLFPRSVLHQIEFNPAQLHREKFELLLGSETRYGLAEIRTFYLYSQINRYSIELASFGSDLYRENFFQFGFGFPIGEWFAAGFHVAGLNCWVKDLSSDFAYAIKAGAQFETDVVIVSAWLNNINVPRISTVDYAPVTYSARLDYNPHPNFDFIFALLGVETGLPFYRCGVEWTPHASMLLCVGFTTRPITIEYGIKITIGRVRLLYSGNRHQQLGLTHDFGIGFTP